MKQSLFLFLFLLSKALCLADTSVGVGQTITITCKYEAERATFEHLSTSNWDYLSISNVEGAAYCTVYGIKEKKNIPILVRYYWTEDLYGHPVTKTDSYTEYVTVEKSATPTSISISPNPLYINELGGIPTDIYVVTTPSSAYSTYKWEVNQYKGNPKAAHLIYTEGQSNKVRADNAGTTYIKVTSAEGLVAEGMIVISTPGSHHSGKDGNISWDLSESGLLKLSGKGQMKEYDSPVDAGRVGKAPWRAYLDHIINVEIEEGITNIASYAFYGCFNLENISIPSSVTSIGSRTFYGCEKLANIKIPNSVQSIGSNAFRDCSKLEEVSLPSSLTQIGAYAFWGCSLNTLILPTNLTSIGERAFEFAFKDTIQTLFIPDGVLDIGKRAFASSYLIISQNFKTIRLPKSCTEIGSQAVEPIENLIVNWETPLVTKNTLYNHVYEKCTLWVPKGTLDKYKNAENWKKFASIKEFDDERDVIEGKIDNVTVTNIEIDPSTVSMSVGDTRQLTAIVSPSSATDKSVTWSSDNESIAIVSNTGIVTALTEGEATITCTANDRSRKTASCYITVRERIPDYTIITSAEGYATFYDSNSDYILPDGLIAQTVVGVNNGKLSYNVIADGTVSGIIPKGTAVVLVGSEKSAKKYNLSPSESSENYKGVNYLYGSDKPTTTDVTGTYYYYKLTYGNGNNSNVFGWYWGNSNGAAFNIEGHRAWLALPKSTTSTRSFSIDGDATGIEEIVQNEENNTIYDLLGRRIGRPNANVIYIKKGKKLLLNKTK